MFVLWKEEKRTVVELASCVSHLLGCFISDPKTHTRSFHPQNWIENNDFTPGFWLHPITLWHVLYFLSVGGYRHPFLKPCPTPPDFGCGGNTALFTQVCTKLNTSFCIAVFVLYIVLQLKVMRSILRLVIQISWQKILSAMSWSRIWLIQFIGTCFSTDLNSSTCSLNYINQAQRYKKQ